MLAKYVSAKPPVKTEHFITLQVFVGCISISNLSQHSAYALLMLLTKNIVEG